MRVVAVKRTQKEPWPTMVGYFDAQVTAYGGPDGPGPASHDNTGLGQVVHDLLTVPAEPFNMVGRQRNDLLSEYIAAIEKGNLIWPKDSGNAALAAAFSEHKYATRDDIYRGTKDGSGSFHLPDTISAGALAWRAASQPEGASEMKPPDQATQMGQGLTRGRMSSYIMGGPGRRTR
jgi:hypothetical protein